MELDTVTVNSEEQTLDNIMKLVETAISYFPADVWNGVNYKGDIKVPNDSELVLNGEIHKSHSINKLIFRLRRLMDKNPLLAITTNPVYYLKSKLSEGKIELVIVHDYMDEHVGVVSLFYLLQDISSKVIAHALGHNRNLKHHVEPLDIMYENLIYNPNFVGNSLCPKCVDYLKKKENV